MLKKREWLCEIVCVTQDGFTLSYILLDKMQFFFSPALINYRILGWMKNVHWSTYVGIFIL